MNNDSEPLAFPSRKELEIIKQPFSFRGHDLIIEITTGSLPTEQPDADIFIKTEDGTEYGRIKGYRKGEEFHAFSAYNNSGGPQTHIPHLVAGAIEHLVSGGTFTSFWLYSYFTGGGKELVRYLSEDRNDTLTVSQVSQQNDSMPAFVITQNVEPNIPGKDDERMTDARTPMQKPPIENGVILFGQASPTTHS